MKHTLTFCLFALLLAPPPLTAGEPEPPIDKILYPGALLHILFGPYAGVNLNMHSGSFSTMENGVICCNFDEGDGIGTVFGIKGFIPLTKHFRLSPRLHYEQRGGDFTAELLSYPFFGSGQSLEYVDMENTLDVTLNTVGIDILATYHPGFAGLYFTAGPSLGFIASQNFRKYERILRPPGVTYLDGGTEKVVFDGEMEIVKDLLLGLRGGLGILVPVTSDIHLDGEALYHFPLGSVSSEGDWNVSALQFTLGILFAL
ncbi:MAG: outer membrane beta-barrel protein [Bacteroidetes bacterium]|nr:outer membrane beta-barrel protein [Bacteroidota bacterium]